MSPARQLMTLACAALMLAGSPAIRAAAVAGPNGTAAQGLRLVPALSAESPQGTAHELSNGRVEAVDLAKSTITLSGKAVPVAVERLQVFGASGAVSGGLRALRPGQAIRFALEPHTAATAPRARASGAAHRPAHAASSGGDTQRPRRIVLIYID